MGDFEMVWLLWKLQKPASSAFWLGSLSGGMQWFVHKVRALVQFGPKNRQLKMVQELVISKEKGKECSVTHEKLPFFVALLWQWMDLGFWKTWLCKSFIESLYYVLTVRTVEKIIKVDDLFEQLPWARYFVIALDCTILFIPHNHL